MATLGRVLKALILVMSVATIKATPVDEIKKPVIIHVKFIHYGVGSIVTTPNSEKFEILGEIKEGTCGQIKRALHIRSGTLVILKIVDNQSDLEEFEELQHEYKMYVRLGAIANELPKENTQAWRAGFARVYGWAVTLEAKKSAMFVMDSFDGDETFTRNLAGNILDMVKAVAYCHTMGIRHADIKEGNFVYSHMYRKYFLIDLGISTIIQKEQTNLYTAGELVQGTPDYFTLYILYLLKQMEATPSPDLAMPGPENDWEALVFVVLKKVGYTFLWSPDAKGFVSNLKKIEALENEISTGEVNNKYYEKDIEKRKTKQQTRILNMWKLKDKLSETVKQDCMSLGIPESESKLLQQMLQWARRWRPQTNVFELNSSAKEYIKPLVYNAEETSKKGYEFIREWQKRRDMWREANGISTL